MSEHLGKCQFLIDVFSYVGVMTYSVSQQTSRGDPYVHITIETDDYTFESLDVRSYYYMSNGDDEELALLTDDDEVLIDTASECIQMTIGYGELTLHLPDGFLDDLESELATLGEEQF